MHKHKKSSLKLLIVYFHIVLLQISGSSKGSDHSCTVCAGDDFMRLPIDQQVSLIVVVLNHLGLYTLLHFVNIQNKCIENNEHNIEETKKLD